MLASSLSLAPDSEALSLWNSVLHGLAARTSSATRDSLQQHTRCLGLTTSTLRLAATSSELIGWARAGHLAAIEAALTRISEGVYELAMLPVEDAGELKRDPSHTFSTFMVSPANQQAREIASEFVMDSEKSSGLLVIHGPSGSGKSHLLQALGHALDEERAGAPALLRGAEQVSLDLINAIWNDDLSSFRERMESSGALLLDDAQALTGRDATQEEMLRTLEALRERRVPMVVCTARAPEKLSGLIAPLRDRLRQAALVQLSPPEWETRVAIVMDRIRRWQVESVPEVASFLAGKLRTNLARLDAMLTSLMMRPACSQGLGDIDAVRHVLNDAGTRAIRVSPDDVVSVVSRHFSVRMRDLRSASRSPRVTTPRQIAMYLVRRYCGHSYPEIGRRFSRHHTTALHSDRLVRKHLDQNGSLRAAVVLLEKELLRMSEDSE